MRNELSNDVVRIRRYGAADVPLLFEAARESVGELSAWVSWCHTDYTVEECQSFVSSSEAAWEQETAFNFGVFDAGGGLFLGGVGLNQFKRRDNLANLGYWVRSGQTGRGVATEAASLAAEFGFEDLGLTRIEILTAEGNAASRRVAEKVGAQQEGVLRSRLVLHDRPHDAVMYSLIAADRSA